MANKIKSAKIIKDKYLLVTVIEDKKIVNMECKEEIHPDLKQAFENMGVHLGVQTGYIFSEDVEDIKTGKADEFHVRGFSISRDESGVVLMGHHIAPDGKAITLNTPLHRFEENPDTRYVFMDDLQERLERTEKEVRAYLYENKIAADPQGKLFVEQGAEGKAVLKEQE